MPAATPTTEPAQITMGSTVAWTKSLADYPASTYTLKYELRSSVTGAFHVTITAAASGDDHAVTLAAATTAAYSAGTYFWFSYVTAGSTRYDIDSGEFEILANPTATTTFDGRSHSKKMLDAIETMLEGNASKDEQSMALEDGRTLAYCSKDELLRFRSYYRREYLAEVSAENIRKGRASGSRILTRFRRPS